MHEDATTRFTYHPYSQILLRTLRTPECDESYNIPCAFRHITQQKKSHYKLSRTSCPVWIRGYNKRRNYYQSSLDNKGFLQATDQSSKQKNLFFGSSSNTGRRLPNFCSLEPNKKLDQNIAILPILAEKTIKT